MSNAKEYKPPYGAIKLAAERLGRHRQSVWRAYQNGTSLKVMIEVARAAVELEAIEAEGRKKYYAMIKQAEKLANEVAGSTN